MNLRQQTTTFHRYIGFILIGYKPIVGVDVSVYICILKCASI